MQRMDDLFGNVDELAEAPVESVEALPEVSFKVVHKYNAIPKLTGTAASLDANQFAKQNRRVISCQYWGPASSDRTHYEILCEIRGLYGKQKFVKFHFTMAGYFAIYNASREHAGGLKMFAEAPPVQSANTTSKLYSLFLDIAGRRGKYKSGVNTCENFARDFYNRATGKSIGGRDEDEFM